MDTVQLAEIHQQVRDNFFEQGEANDLEIYQTWLGPDVSDGANKVVVSCQDGETGTCYIWVDGKIFKEIDEVD